MRASTSRTAVSMFARLSTQAGRQQPGFRSVGTVDQQATASSIDHGSFNPTPSPLPPPAPARPSQADGLDFSIPFSTITPTLLPVIIEMREDISPEELAALSPRERASRAATLAILHEGAAMSDSERAVYFARMERELNERLASSNAEASPAENSSSPSPVPSSSASSGDLSPSLNVDYGGIKFSPITTALLPSIIALRRTLPQSSSSTPKDRARAKKVLAILQHGATLPEPERITFFADIDAGKPFSPAPTGSPKAHPSTVSKQDANAERAINAVKAGNFAQVDALSWDAYLEHEKARRDDEVRQMVSRGLPEVEQAELMGKWDRDSRGRVWWAERRRWVIAHQMLKTGEKTIEEIRRILPPSMRTKPPFLKPTKPTTSSATLKPTIDYSLLTPTLLPRVLASRSAIDPADLSPSELEQHSSILKILRHGASIESDTDRAEYFQSVCAAPSSTPTSTSMPLHTETPDFLVDKASKAYRPSSFVITSSFIRTSKPPRPSTPLPDPRTRARAIQDVHSGAFATEDALSWEEWEAYTAERWRVRKEGWLKGTGAEATGEAEGEEKKREPMDPKEAEKKVKKGVTRLRVRARARREVMEEMRREGEGKEGKKGEEGKKEVGEDV